MCFPSVHNIGRGANASYALGCDYVERELMKKRMNMLVISLLLLSMVGGVVYAAVLIADDDVYLGLATHY